MAAALSAMHLLRRFLLFALTVLFLLTLLRAGYALWQFPRFDTTEQLIAVFVQGLRFDLALVGVLLLPVVVLGSLLGMFRSSLGLARLLIVLLLMGALAFVLLSEFVSPWFIANDGVRPGLAELRGVADPVAMLLDGARAAPVPAALAVALIVLVLIAFWSRLEISRLLGYPVGKASALVLLVIGTATCLVAIWSGAPLLQPELGVETARIADDPTVNELALNGGYKLLAPWIEPALKAISSVPTPRMP